MTLQRFATALRLSIFMVALVGTCFFATDNNPAIGQIVTHVPLYTFELDDLVAAVSDAGDVNGDNVPDLIVGVTTFSGSGSVRVFSGADGSDLYTVSGGDDGCSFGSSVSGLGDVNGDGSADFIVGAPRAEGGDGSARVISGADGSTLYTYSGGFTDALGTSVSGLGDVSGDGVPDFIIGAPRAISNGFTRAGNVRLFSGADGSILYTVNGEDDLISFGASASGAGDINGDGFPDFIVGVPFDGTNGFGAGSARVLSGVDGSNLYTFNGEDDLDEFGSPVSGAGDLNGDGIPDVIVAAPQRLRGGIVRALSGSDGSILYSFTGANLALFGQSVSGAGDVNGDGFADFIIGAPADNTDGRNRGSVRVISGRDGSTRYTFFGDADNDGLGCSASGAGDINGDGLADFIVGAGGFDRYARVFVSQIVPLGDVNHDSTVDFLDISPFISVLSNGDFQAAADIDQNGTVDFLDIAPFIAILSGP